MYWQLGDIIFDGLYGFETFVRTATSPLAKHEYIGGKPRLQKTGDDLDELELVVNLHRSFCNVENEIAKFRKYKSDGSILSLVAGNGTPEGSWVIQTVEEQRKHAGPNGTIIYATLMLKLWEIAEADPAQAESDAQKNRAVALKQNDPNEYQKFSQLQGKGIQIMTNLNNSIGLTAQADTYIQTADKNPSTKENSLKKGKSIYLRAQNTLQDFEQGAQTVQDRITSYDQLQENIQDTKQYFDLAIKACEDGDVAGALEASRNARGSIGAVGGGSFDIAVLTGIRKI